MSSIGLARPLTRITSGGCLERKATFDRAQAVVPTTVRRGSRCSGGPWSCSWRYPPAEVVRACAASCRTAKAERGRGLAGVFAHPVKTPGICAGRPAGSARRGGLSQERPQRSRTMEGTFDLGDAAGIDVPAASHDQAIGSGTARRDHDQPPARGLGGSRSTGHSGEPKKRRSPTAPRESAGAAVDRTEAGARAVKHAAVGGRMTARWSGVEPRTARWQHLAPQARSAPQSPKVVSISSARDVNVGCRNGVEAS